MSDEVEDKKNRIVELIRKSSRPAAESAAGSVNIRNLSGEGNVIAPHSRVTIVVKSEAPTPPAEKSSRRKSWRDELLSAIRTKAEALAMDEEQLVELAAKVVRKRVVVISIETLGEDDLARLYEAVHALKRPALD
jgi:hypothetical protein